jgi:hypothetical protein
MGLDQYLSARKYIGCWAHNKEDERKAYRAVARAAGLKKWLCEGSPHVTVEMSAAYWRKANQIHRWFVENVQGGEDDCGTYYVEKEQLRALRDLCAQVLGRVKLVPGKVASSYQIGEGGKLVPNLVDGKVVDNPKAAMTMLPAQEGFFFGSTDYDEWYVRDLEETVRQVDAALATFGDQWEFYYHASW